MGLIRKLIHAVADAVAPPQGPEEDVRPQERDQTTYRVQEPEKKKRKRGGIIGRSIRVYKMFSDRDFRWRHSNRISVMWALSMIIVGIIFVCLSATGVYPESIVIQKELNVYVENIVKYSLYIVAGILTLIAAYMANAEILKNRQNIDEQRSLHLLMPKMLLLVSVLIALATIGMTIQVQVDVNNAYTLAWWSWLIMVIIILQRIFFSCACTAALWTLIDAETKKECRDLYNSPGGDETDIWVGK